MQQIQRAALAPAEPSSADRRVAAKAASKAAKARKEIAEASMEADNPLKKEHGAQAGGSIKVDGTPHAADTSNANAVDQPNAVQPERKADEAKGAPSSSSRPDGAPQVPKPSPDSVRPTRAAQDVTAHDGTSKTSKTSRGDTQERATLSRPMHVNAYAKAASSSYAKADQTARPTLSMNIYG
jgi:hypothetical protein